MQLLQATNRPAEAEPLMRRALAIDETAFGAEHPNVARDLNNLASLLQDTNRLAEAEPLVRRALAYDEIGLRAEHPNDRHRTSTTWLQLAPGHQPPRPRPKELIRPRPPCLSIRFHPSYRA